MFLHHWLKGQATFLTFFKNSFMFDALLVCLVTSGTLPLLRLAGGGASCLNDPL